MADCFKAHDVEKLLAGKHVAFLGDSVTRAIYKVGVKKKDCFGLKIYFSGLCLVGQ